MNGIKQATRIQMDSMKTNKKYITKVISPKLTNNIYCIPDCPEYIDIKNVCDLYFLKKMEYDYEEFLEKRYQILLLLNMMEEVFKIRDLISMRINELERKYRITEQKLDYKIEILFQ